MSIDSIPSPQTLLTRRAGAFEQSRMTMDESGRAMFITNDRFANAMGWFKSFYWVDFLNGSDSVYPVNFAVINPMITGFYTSKTPTIKPYREWSRSFRCIKPNPPDPTKQNILSFDLYAPFAKAEIPAYLVSAGWDVITGVCVHIGDPASAFSANFFFTGMTRFFLIQPSGTDPLENTVLAARPFSSPLANGAWHPVLNQKTRTNKTQIAIFPDWFDPLMTESGYVRNPYNSGGYTGYTWARQAAPASTWSGRMPSITVRIQKSAVLDAQGVDY